MDATLTNLLSGAAGSLAGAIIAAVYGERQLSLTKRQMGATADDAAKSQKDIERRISQLEIAIQTISQSISEFSQAAIDRDKAKDKRLVLLEVHALLEDLADFIEEVGDLTGDASPGDDKLIFDRLKDFSSEARFSTVPTLVARAREYLPVQGIDLLSDFRRLHRDLWQHVNLLKSVSGEAGASDLAGLAAALDALYRAGGNLYETLRTEAGVDNF